MLYYLMLPQLLIHDMLHLLGCLLISKYNGKVIACDYMLFSAHHNRTALLLRRATTYFMIRKERPKPPGKAFYIKKKNKKTARPTFL